MQSRCLVNVGSKPPAPLGKRVVYIVGCALCSARNVLGEELEEPSTTDLYYSEKKFSSAAHPRLRLSAKAAFSAGMDRACDEETHDVDVSTREVSANHCACTTTCDTTYYSLALKRWRFGILVQILRSISNRKDVGSETDSVMGSRTLKFRC